jgi:hypothetical protein
VPSPGPKSYVDYPALAASSTTVALAIGFASKALALLAI